jgi:hypothetical protein
MDEIEIDRWIARMGEGEAEDAVETLVEQGGEPALHRVYQVCEGIIQIPLGTYWRDSVDYRSVALGGLGARYPETFLGLAEGRVHFRDGTIRAMGFTGDPRLKAIAKEALKNGWAIR